MDATDTQVAQEATKIVSVNTANLTGKLVFVAVVAVVAIVIQRLLVHFAKKTFGTTRQSSASIFLNLTRVFVWSIALLAVLQPVFGIKPTAFITALGVSSLVISLGMQDSISNIIGGLALTVGHVIAPGDDISVSGISGEILDIDWRSTSVKDTQGNVQVIPNSVLNKSSLMHLAPGTLYKIELPVNIAKTSDIDLDAIQKDIVDTVKSSLGDSVSDMNTPANKQKTKLLQNRVKDLIDMPNYEGIVEVDDPIQVSFTSLSSTTIQTSIVVYLEDGTNTLDASDKLVRALVSKTYIA